MIINDLKLKINNFEIEEVSSNNEVIGENSDAFKVIKLHEIYGRPTLSNGVTNLNL